MPDSWVTDQPQLTPSSPRGAPLIRCVCSCRTAQLRSTVLTCMCLAQEKKKKGQGAQKPSQDSWEPTEWRKRLVWCMGAFPHLFLPSIPPSPSSGDTAVLSQAAAHGCKAPGFSSTPLGSHRDLLCPATPVLLLRHWHWRASPGWFKSPARRVLSPAQKCHRERGQPS